MKKLTVIKPESKAKKPFKTGGDWLRGSNCEKIKVSPSQIVEIKKKCHKSLGVDKYISVIHITDAGEFYRASCCQVFDMSIVSNKAVKRDKAAEQAINKRQQARNMLERIKELESLIFECSIEGVGK